MSTGLVSFYKMKGSLSSGEYPLLASGQNLSTYLVGSATVKYAKGLQTRVVVPSFTGWNTANIAQIDGSFYWITESKESTTYSTSIEFLLDYMGPTSFFRSGNTVTGAWHKTATNECPYLTQQITDGYMQSSLKTALPAIAPLRKVGPAGPLQIQYKGYWVQVAGFTSSAHTTLKKIGLFLEIAPGGDPSSFHAAADATSGVYPNFDDLITDMFTETGIMADQVIDCSISQRCPYAYTVNEVAQGDPLTTLYRANITGLSLTQNSNGHYIYDLSSYEPSDNVTSYTLEPGDFLRACGAYEIRDWNLNTVMRIPPLVNASGALTVKVRTHSDLSGIYTIITCNDQQISIPEGKLPYIEDAWERYKAYQMDTDRQAMENAIHYAEHGFETDKTSGIMSTVSGSASTGVVAGAMTGSAGIGAITGGLSAIGGMLTSLYEGTRALELNRMQARDAYQLSMKSAKQQPQTSYNVGYGLIYTFLTQINTLGIYQSLPRDADSAYYSAWVAEYGYPCEGVKTITLTNGYYQGKLLSSDSAKSGMYWDECNRIFMNGFKFVSP